MQLKPAHLFDRCWLFLQVCRVGSCAFRWIVECLIFLSLAMQSSDQSIFLNSRVPVASFLGLADLRLEQCYGRLSVSKHDLWGFGAAYGAFRWYSGAVLEEIVHLKCRGCRLTSSIHSITLCLCQGRTGWVMVVPRSAVVGDFDRSLDSAGNGQETSISAR